MGDELEGLIDWLRPYAEYLISLAPTGSLRVTSVRRSSANQARLYEARRAGRWPYPVAPPGCSQHEFGYAWDMVDAEQYGGELLRQLGAVWESWGGAWGGRFRDPIHFGLRGTLC